jgi:small conductance mechanosensitive channel
MAQETLSKAFGYFDSLFAGFYSRILVAVIILLVGFVLAKLIGKVTGRILRELEVNVILKKATRIDVGLEHILSQFMVYFVYFITITMALNHLQVTTTVLQMISAAIIIIIIISVVLAIKDFIPNTFAGFYIYRNKFVKQGEIIRVKGIEGKVVHVNLVETKIETKEGDVVYIPNSALTKTEVIKVNVEEDKWMKKKEN